MDWYHNEQGQQVLAVEDDASRRVFDMIETAASSVTRAGLGRGSGSSENSY